MQERIIRVVRACFAGVILFAVAMIMQKNLQTSAPVWMGLGLFALYLGAEWVHAQSAPRRQSPSPAIALSSQSGRVMVGLAVVLGATVLLVAYFAIKGFGR